MEETYPCSSRKESTCKSASVNRLIIIIVGVLLHLPMYAGVAAQLDSTVRKALTDKLDEYFKAIEGEGLETKKRECDFLIEAASDSLVRQFVAVSVYEHYLNSPVMGSEAVAVHVFDRWFQNGAVSMPDEDTMNAARIFAMFNRQSLTGMKAPYMELETPEGAVRGLFPADAPSGRWTVLYFYDTDCAKCRVQTILLRNMLYTESFPIDFHAVYVDDDREAWGKYISDNFSIPESELEMSHLWDPEMHSDFQMKYGVIRTPRLFLINPSGVIVGRGLDAKALSQMLHSVFDEVKLEYGSEEGMKLFDQVFGMASETGRKDIISMADHIASRTLSKGDTVMFRQMAGDLLYWLVSKKGEEYKEGLDYLIDSHILPRSDVWSSSDDTLKVVSFAEMIDELLSRTAPGTVVPDLKISSTLVRGNRERQVKRSLRRIGGKRNLIIFYTEGCNVCDAEKAAARRLASEGKYNVCMVNVDEQLSVPSVAAKLFDSFDLSSLPFIIETDRRGRIVGRYKSFVH